MAALIGFAVGCVTGMVIAYAGSQDPKFGQVLEGADQIKSGYDINEIWIDSWSE